MPYTKAQRAAFRRAKARAQSRGMWKSRGPGRGYRPGVSRFGRIAQPEMKSQVEAYRLQLPEGQEYVTQIPPDNIEQGVQQDQRLGNRIAGKFLTLKMLLSMTQAGAPGAQTGNIMRWVLWSNKDPVGAAAPSLGPGFTLTSFINTKDVKIHRTGYMTFPSLGATRYKCINLKLKNRVFDFTDNQDDNVNTPQRYYISMWKPNNGTALQLEMQSKFYFSDP